jgi:hypothetical protein
MSEYPKMLFKRGGDEIIFDVSATYAIANDAEAEKALRADGFGDVDVLLTADPLDHDGDGKKGGSRRRKPAASEQQDAE